MPKKIRELKSLLLRSGFTYKSAKGSHSKWIHPKLSKAIIIADKDGSNAKERGLNKMQNLILSLASLSFIRRGIEGEVNQGHKLYVI